MKKIYALCLVLISALALPFILWQVQPEKKLPIAIIDKTIPNESYREHLGLTWLLKHLKYTNKDGTTINAATDYFGFVPDEKSNTYAVRDLPTNFDDYDVIYLADTYGVYKKDLPWMNHPREGSRSSKIYGGLELKEWQSIESRLTQNKKSLLIAEFNTFASPTSKDVRDRVTKYLGLEWSGWIGRYFNELNPKKNSEIPQWILDDFGDNWDYNGEGFILVNDIDYQVVVLEKEPHFGKRGIHLSFTEEGQKQFKLNKSPDYQYWFDIVTPKAGTTVLANYEWDLTDEGKKLLQKHQIPLQFAAILKNEQAPSTSYYFAGDYNDTSNVPFFYKVKGLPNIYNVAQSFSDQAFYWKTYFPMMESILQEFEQIETKQKDPVYANDLQLHSRINQNKFEVLKDGKWTQLTLKGVNIGMGKPGVFPGEAAITEDEYYRWFEQIGNMNANTIRVYTLHPPGFYNALKRYNDSHKDKIYVLHGVWINEELLEESLDAFEEKNMKDFQNEMKTISDVIHGNAVVKDKVGHASGIYQSDISEYVIGWILGIEWYPLMVENTNKLHKDIGEYEGNFFKTKNAHPFEHWLAMQMDILAQYEMKTYHSIRPMSFTNWPTTDILEHPSDATDSEDIVSVNPNVIYTKNDMDLAGQFASYHIYPYYPDFMHYDKKYQSFIDHRGKYNSYAGYLNELNNAHRLPILVAEFGIPSSRGLTHENKFGKNQGFMTEQEQGKLISEMYEDIVEEKMIGGLVFTWQDEWFKRTWNTMDYDNPNRRPFWSNAQTNEQQFGLLSFDRNKIQVDGNVNDWSTPPLYEKKQGDLKKLYVDHDERNLYIRLDYDPKRKGAPKLLLDTVPNQGNHFISNNKNITFANGVDFLVDLSEKKSHILVDQYYDMFFYQYKKPEVPKEKLPVKNSGVFTPILYALDKEYNNPEAGITYDFKTTETGKLRQGNSNPESKDYDSLADYYINEEKGIIELRIPWLLIQAKDPSQKEFTGDLYENGLNASTLIEKLNIGILFENEEGTITDSLPTLKNNQLSAMKGYTWDNWNEPLYQERLKQSYYIIQKLWEEKD
ncbi:hypothetical protein [Bacillus massiliigorillae]|uniref:hypothetical protein n=1 Tax=Bacillus massiliigorillae TaxID=1243664 RepID=UPI0003A69D1B|nr:hypothetical protein [Bacillus massiliigorillae]